MKIRVFEAFAGYGSQAMAIKRLSADNPQFEAEFVGISEIDKYAIKAYNAVHGETKNYGDITKIDWSQVPDFDLFTYSFPCQDVSTAGLQKGLQEDSGTRSSLLWECRKAIRIKRPKYLLLENVKGLVSKNNMPFLQKWLVELEEYGYTNYVKVLNAKDYGVQQNRERVFVVSVLGNEPYEFPKPFALDMRLIDVLSQNVNDRYLLNSELQDNIRMYLNTKNTCDIIQIANIAQEKGFSNPQCGRGYDPMGIAPTIDTMQGGGRVPKIIEPKFVGYTRDEKGKVVSRHFMDVCNTIHGSTGSGGNTDCFVCCEDYRIRKLTERECFRLMGVSDADVDKIQSAGISNTQQYKMAGNGIVVDVLYHIFRKLFVDREPKIRQMTIFD